MKATARVVLLTGFALALWWGIASITPEYIVPTPVASAHAAVERSGRLVADCSVTAVETAAGLGLAIMTSLAIACVSRLFPFVESIAMPYAIALKSVPVVAIAPLLVIWFGNGIAGKIVLSSLICFFPVLIGLVDGMKTVPIELRRMADVWGTTRFRRLLFLDLPFSAPYFCSSLKVAGPLAVVGAVVAEFSGSDQGLGYLVLVSAYRVDTPTLFVGLVIVSSYGIALYQGAALLEWQVLRQLRLYWQLQQK